MRAALPCTRSRRYRRCRAEFARLDPGGTGVQENLNIPGLRSKGQPTLHLGVGLALWQDKIIVNFRMAWFGVSFVLVRQGQTSRTKPVKYPALHAKQSLRSKALVTRVYEAEHAKQSLRNKALVTRVCEAEPAKQSLRSKG